MITNKNPCFTALRELAKVYFFDPSSQDGRLAFVPRGGPEVMTLDPGDVLEDVDEEEELKRKDSMSVPRVINLDYHDIDGGLSPDKQTSDRSLDNRSTGEMVVQTPVLLLTDDAKQLVVISHKVAVEEQRGEIHLSLPDSYLALTVGDVVEYRGDRLRIFEVELDAGFQNYKLSHDRVSAYVSDAEGIPPVKSAPPAATEPGLTRLEFIDSPILADQDDFLGYYVAVSGSTTAWRGARIDLSRDGGANYTESEQTAYDTIMGDLLDPLPAHPVAYPDELNRFRVAIQTPYSALQSATFAEQLNRHNRAIVGDELIAFGDVTEVEPGVWELGYLLRGRRHTTVAAHPAGTRFVLMDRNQLAFIPGERYDLDQTLTFRTTSLGSVESTVTSWVFTGQSQTEPAPTYLRAERDGNGNVAVSWQGVARLGGRTRLAMGAHFLGYRVVIGGVEYDTQQPSLIAGIPASLTLIRVHQRNNYTGLGPAAEVLI